MTVGNVESDRTFPVYDSYGSYSGRGGVYYSRVWSGGDRSKTGRPSRPAFVPSFHEYAGDLNLKRFKRDQRLAILGDVYSRWRKARDDFFTQLKAYHLAKAEWREKTRGEMHPYELSLIHQKNGVGSYWNDPGNYGSRGDVSLSGSFGWVSCPNPWTNEDEIALINKIQGGLDGGVGFHAGVALAEVDQTFSMIRSNAKRFRRIGESLVSGDLNKALRVAFNGSAANHIKGFSGLRGIADNYLLYQFGIKPLVHDVLDAARSYGYKSGRPRLIRVAVSKRVTSHSKHHGYWAQKAERQVRKSIVCYLQTDEIADESGMLDLPSILWERFPYSFVVDWWINIGAYLQALHVARTVNSHTKFCVTTTDRTTVGPISSGSVYKITTDDGGFSRHVWQKRIVSDTLAVPPPSIRPILHQDAEVSLRHTLEAISLIAQKGPAFRSALNRLQNG